MAFETEEPLFVITSSGIRFVNFIIDMVGYLFLMFLHALIFDTLLGIVPKNGSTWLGIYSLSLYVLYYTVFEYKFGKTPGKFVTKTHVVDLDGAAPTFSKLLLRNICRFVPFDALTFLFSKRGIHDRFSGTCVINDE